ncbi:MAG: HAD-IIB family hydrolase [Phycisphaeraceae bacterium]|nr:HAD-IIB family hydrolase [Phycisphaeraceae bacterium]
MKYRLIGIDLDGTLLNRSGRPSPENLAAIRAARDAGAIVVPCTGRAWIESKKALAELVSLEIGVFVGGAAVSSIQTGTMLDISTIEPYLAMELVQYLWDLPEAVLAFRDFNSVGHDYLVTGAGSLSANTEWWFQATKARVQFQRDLTPADLHHTLRVGIVATESRMNEVTARLRRDFAGRIVMQSFQAVQMPDPAESVHVLEIFGWGVDKWRGLRWIADQHMIGSSEVAVIGDEVNDLAMMQSAGCAIAMGNAIDAVKAIARHTTRDCDQHGVAHALERLIKGEWG